MTEAEKAWCRSLFKTIVDGGVWSIPRSGLLFRKNAETRSLVMVARMPHDPEMPITAEQLDELQRHEFEELKARFGAVDIGVEWLQ